MTVCGMPGDVYVKGKTYTNQGTIIASVRRGGYKISKAYMMQCYSAYKGLTPDGRNVDYASDWKNAAVHFYGYKGLNAFMIDF